MEQWIQTLKDRGQRITEGRKILLSWLAKREGVFCAQDMIKGIPSVDKVLVYRSLELFQRLDIIHPVALEGDHQYYEVHAKKNHHHHIVCTECSGQGCVPCDIRSIPSSFKQVHHSVVYTGICNSCAA